MPSKAIFSLLLLVLLDIIYSLNAPLTLPESCGMPAQARIVGGFESETSQWPWMVSLRFAWGQHFCGGFLVTESHVVTAAHCVYFFSSLPQHLRVAAGSHVIQQALVLAHIKTVVIHPNFGNASAFDSDVAVLELSSPLSFNFVVSPVCLPSLETSTGQPVVAVGWGKIDQAATSFSNVLQHVQVTVFELDRCSSIYEDLVDDSMICAGTEEGGYDSCLGDSGGPLLLQGSDGVWQAAGIISFGQGCGDPKYPGVYTNLMGFKDWVAEVVET